MHSNRKKRCDVCIIGAGPAGLAALSAIHEPYTLDSMTNTQVNNVGAFVSIDQAHRALSIGGVYPYNVILTFQFADFVHI